MQTINKVSEIGELLSQLGKERLRAISLTKLADDTGLSFLVTTTKREVEMLVGHGSKATLEPLVSTAQQSCIGACIVYLTLSESPLNFEMVLENGFSIRTID